MSRYMTIEVGEKEYKLGFPNRKAVKIAEEKGLDVINNLDKIISLTDKLFYTGLLAFQENIKEEEAEILLEKYIDEGGEPEEILTFLTEEYMGFIKSPEAKKKKKAKIVKI